MKTSATPTHSGNAKAPETRPPAQAPGHGPLRTVVGAAGNQLVQRLFADGMVRASLRMGGTTDPEEGQADQLAKQVVEGGHCPCGGRGGATCHCGGHGQPSIRRQVKDGHHAPAASLHGDLGLSGGRPLHDRERSFFEPRFGVDLSGVRLHSGSRAEGAANAIAARAFSVGSDVAFGAGELDFDHSDGRRLMAHELAHVALGHGGIRRRTDMEAEMVAERAEARRRAEDERRRRHEAWEGSVQSQFGRDLANQSRTIGEERDRIELALTAQRGAAFQAAIAGEGWLQQKLAEQGYSGPTLAEVREKWAEALVVAETLKLGASRGDVTSEARLTGLQAIPTFYDSALQFAQAAEEAHESHVEAENRRRDAEYQARLAEWRQRERYNRESQGPIGEPGERAARAGMAISLGPAPDAPLVLTPPPAVSGQIPAARARVYAADEVPQWEEVGRDANRIGNALATLVVTTLPERHDVRAGIEYLQGLDTRLGAFEEEHPLAVRIPAVFYPNDRTIERTETGGAARLAPEAIPWQFYLINTGVTSHDQPARSGGQWQLIDLTSSRRFRNEIEASDFDSARLQQGDKVDPPIELYSGLNSRIRFPEGRLYFTQPSGRSYVLETTEPWSLSDFLEAVGIALAAIAIVASLVATGGASAPLAVAFYAGLGAAAAGIGSTLANLHEREQQGILTSADIDAAMISIAIDLVTAASMGLGRLATAPAAAARLGLTGERFIVLQRVTQVARGGALAGDAYQAWSFTAGVISSLRAVDAQPGLSDAERDQMRAQIVRRALLTGALLTIAIRGDVQDLQAGRALRVTHVDEHGVMHAADPAVPREHVDAPAGTTGPRVSPHPDASPAVHGASQRAGTDIPIGAQTHAVAAAGTGRNRHFYFCSDLCQPIVDRLNAVLAVLPQGHPFAPAIRDIRNQAREATQKLRGGQLTQEAADKVAADLSARMRLLSGDSDHFAALMNTDPALLAAHRTEIKERIRAAMGSHRETLGAQRERQEGARASRDRDPLAPPETRSSLETDIMGGVDVREARRPGGALQPIRFDTGNFSHTHAEALVPDLPRGLASEQTVVRPDGSVGRADRVRYVYDADGDIIGAHVYEIKPNTDEQQALGDRQVGEYVDGFRNKIREELADKGKPFREVDEQGRPLFSGQVRGYNQERMLAVLRALRGARRDAARMAEYEAIARQVFASTPPPATP
jgi:hypothetical protein